MGGPVSLDHNITEEIYNWQQWIVKVVDELYQSMELSGPLPWAKLRLSLATCVEVVGSAQELAHLANFSLGKVSAWLHSENRLSFESVLRLCYVLNISLVQLITNDQMVLKETLQRREVKHPSRPAYPAYLPVNRELALEAIQRALVQEGVPLSVAQIARLTYWKNNAQKIIPPRMYFNKH